MKLHDFGLWFWIGIETACPTWSITIPGEGAFDIYYDGNLLGWQYRDFYLKIVESKPRIIKFKNELPHDCTANYFIICRQLTMDDFEIVENPDYRGD